MTAAVVMIPVLLFSADYSLSTKSNQSSYTAAGLLFQVEEVSAPIRTGEPKKDVTSSILFLGHSERNWYCSSHCVISEAGTNEELVTSGFGLM